MPFEEEIAELNQAYFFREFTYSSTTFHATPHHEVELADSLLWVGDDLIVYQIKEREEQGSTTAEQEQRWFKRQVKDKATKQIRDTLGYLQDHADITLENHRGDEFNLNYPSIENVQKLVVFKPAQELPEALKQKKYHESTTAGVIIHMIQARDYKGLIRTLLTPAEFMDYLTYREELIRTWGEHLNTLPEQALLGHYMTGETADRPEVTHALPLRDIDHRSEQWDVSGIMHSYADRITHTQNPRDYYRIITPLAQLKRNELEQFKQRFSLSLEKARANEFVLPYRVAYPRLDCGFVFIPLTDETIPHRASALRNLTAAHKYDQRLQKCIGITFSPDGPEHYTVEWCLIEHPWEHDPEFEEQLTNNFPFREVRQVRTERYYLRSNQEE